MLYQTLNSPWCSEASDNTFKNLGDFINQQFLIHIIVVSNIFIRPSDIAWPVHFLLDFTFTSWRRSFLWPGSFVSGQSPEEPETNTSQWSKVINAEAARDFWTNSESHQLWSSLKSTFLEKKNSAISCLLKEIQASFCNYMSRASHWSKVKHTWEQVLVWVNWWQKLLAMCCNTKTQF